MSYVWIGIAISFLFIELIDKKVSSIWFSISAFIAFIVSLFSHNYFYHFFVFALIGFFLMVILRNYAIERIKKYINDKLINKKGKIIREVSKDKVGIARIGMLKIKVYSNKKIKKGKKIKIKEFKNRKFIVVEDK